MTVLGAGVAGLSAAVLLARDGHRVTLVERDALDGGPAAAAPAWPRKGIPHFLQPHAFIPRGRAELKQHLPDVYAALLAAGAHEIDTRSKLPGTATPADEDLQYLGVRRPLIEWALRRAVHAEPNITVRAGEHVTGLGVEAGRVTGVRVGTALTTADLVVDALGRRTPTPGWLAEAGAPAAPVERSDCGVVYYGRYYALRAGFDLPDGPWILGPRGDLGYMGWATFPGDNRTFAGLLAVPPGVPQWQAFKEESVFEAAVTSIPGLRQWVDPGGVEPITRVLPMAGLRNSIRSYDATSAGGLVPVGDAYSHTDPVIAHGLSFGIIHAAELAKALRDNEDAPGVAAAYVAATAPELRERYEFATALDEQRHRMWSGGPVDFAHRDGDYALFTLVAAGTVALQDPDVFRMFVRRMGLLDSTTVLDGDADLQRRIEAVFTQLLAMPRPPPGPSRDEMLTIAASG